MAERGGALVNRLTSNPEQRMALQNALYNTAMFIMLGLVCAALVALYNMMYMFLTPMLWAVLVGTVMFPLKRRVTDITQGWLQNLQDRDTPLIIAILVAPYKLLYNASEIVFNTSMSATGGMIASVYVLLKILSYERTFVYVISWIGRVYQIFDSFIHFFGKPWIFPLVVLYFAIYATWIYFQDRKQINKKLARSLSLPIWIYVLSWISGWFGPFRVLFFGGSAAILAALSAGLVRVDVEEHDSATTTSTVAENLLNEAEEKIKDVIEPERPKQLPEVNQQSLQSLDSALTGDAFIRIIAVLCALLWIVRHDTALVIIVVPFVFAILRRLGDILGVFNFLSTTSSSFFETMYPTIKKVVDVTVAGPLRQFVKVLFTSDQLLTSSLRAHMDVLSSVVVMALLALGTLFSLIFVGFQLHGEMVHLVRLSTNVVNSRPEWLSTVFNYTEEQLESNDIDLDNYVEQAYQQGRTWLAANVRSLADPKDTIRADMLEEQVKKIVDNVYRLWEQRNIVPSASSAEIVHKDWYHQLTSVTDLHALKEELTLIIKDNVDTLLNVAHSVWGILATNISFLSGVLGAFATLLFGFGMDLLNLLIAWVVFLTMLYYLLASSRDQWLPLEWASQLTALFNTAGTSTPITSKQESSTVNDITSAVEQAIFGVFVLSIKMSIFYGLYTYFVHSLFDLNIVFVPSLAAAIFAAIPIMAPYIVCVFGLFELYLVRGETAASIVFLIISIAPVMFADAAFYKEVKYAHPYVTGLAVIGGMYWLSLQGAIIGPIILCIFLVLVNVYMKFAKGK